MESPDARAILEDAIQPMVESGVDTLVLGCTHFPFVMPLIQEIAGEGVSAIDPAPAVAKRVAALLEESDLLAADYGTESRIVFATSGDKEAFRRSLKLLLGMDADTLQLVWSGDKIIQKR